MDPPEKGPPPRPRTPRAPQRAAIAPEVGPGPPRMRADAGAAAADFTERQRGVRQLFVQPNTLTRKKLRPIFAMRRKHCTDGEDRTDGEDAPAIAHAVFENPELDAINIASEVESV